MGESLTNSPEEIEGEDIISWGRVGEGICWGQHYHEVRVLKLDNIR